MTQQQHTAGPWRANPWRGWNGAHVIGAHGETVVVMPRKADRSIHQKEADALLIAAAPDLLAQLKTAERWLSGMHSETDEGVETELRDVHSAAWKTIDKMRAAIAKATGVR